MVSVGRAMAPAGATDVYGHAAAPGAVLLRFPEVGAFLVTPDRIVAEPVSGLHPDVLRSFVLGPAIGTLLHLRGHLVLHASAVRFGLGSVAFLGDSEFGKSTVAAACWTAGHGLVADDVTMVELPEDGGAMVVPAFPRMKVWPESLRALGLDPDAFPKVHPELDKRDVRAVDGFQHEPVPLAGLYVLREGGADPAVTELDPQAAFAALLTNSYAADLLEATGTREHHFQQVAQLVGRVRVRSLVTGSPLEQVRRVPAVVAADLST